MDTYIDFDLDSVIWEQIQTQECYSLHLLCKSIRKMSRAKFKLWHSWCIFLEIFHIWIYTVPIYLYLYLFLYVLMYSVSATTKYWTKSGDFLWKHPFSHKYAFHFSRILPKTGFGSGFYREKKQGPTFGNPGSGFDLIECISIGIYWKPLP